MSISARNISKSYQGRPAVTSISFEIGQGEVFGLIGPDGAGKTTLFRILTTVLLADSGTASVAGHDVVSGYREIRKRVGYMPGRFSLYPDLTVAENLDFFATIFNTTVEANMDIIGDIYSGIAPFKDRRAGNLSGGMKQKLALSCALIHRPEVLFLDEPTTGVDPVSRMEFWQVLKRLRHEGITILVSTPYMDEAALCDRIALIQGGHLLGIDTPKGFVSKYPRPLYAVHAGDRYGLIEALKAYPNMHSAYPFGESVHYTDQRHKPDLDELTTFLGQRGVSGARISPITPSIEDSFMELAP